MMNVVGRGEGGTAAWAGVKKSTIGFRSITPKPFEIFEHTWLDYRTGQRGMLRTRMTTLLIFIFELCPLIHILLQFRSITLCNLLKHVNNTW